MLPIDEKQTNNYNNTIRKKSIKCNNRFKILKTSNLFLETRN